MNYEARKVEEWIDAIIERDKDKPVSDRHLKKCHEFFVECERYFKGR